MKNYYFNTLLWNGFFARNKDVTSDWPHDQWNWHWKQKARKEKKRKVKKKKRKEIKWNKDKQLWK